MLLVETTCLSPSFESLVSEPMLTFFELILSLFDVYTDTVLVLPLLLVVVVEVVTPPVVAALAALSDIAIKIVWCQYIMNYFIFCVRFMCRF